MFVKICGIRLREDAFAAVDAGASALGFVFHPGSPRFANPEDIALWARELPSDVLRVGVFVDRPPEEVESIAEKVGLDVVQLHGNERPEDAPQSVRVWKAFRVIDELPQAVHDFPAECVLLDGGCSGASFCWSLAREVNRRFLLAGGLNEHNIGAAVNAAQPWGVDVSSAVESYPGKKDHARMARFVRACHSLTPAFP